MVRFIHFLAVAASATTPLPPTANVEKILGLFPKVGNSITAVALRGGEKQDVGLIHSRDGVSFEAVFESVYSDEKKEFLGGDVIAGRPEGFEGHEGVYLLYKDKGNTKNKLMRCPFAKPASLDTSLDNSVLRRTYEINCKKSHEINISPLGVSGYVDVGVATLPSSRPEGRALFITLITPQCKQMNLVIDSPISPWEMSSDASSEWYAVELKSSEKELPVAGKECRSVKFVQPSAPSNEGIIQIIESVSSDGTLTRVEDVESREQATLDLRRLQAPVEVSYQIGKMASKQDSLDGTLSTYAWQVEGGEHGLSRGVSGAGYSHEWSVGLMRDAAGLKVLTPLRRVIGDAKQLSLAPRVAPNDDDPLWGDVKQHDIAAKENPDKCKPLTFGKKPLAVTLGFSSGASDFQQVVEFKSVFGTVQIVLDHVGANRRFLVLIDGDLWAVIDNGDDFSVANVSAFVARQSLDVFIGINDKRSVLFSIPVSMDDNAAYMCFYKKSGVVRNNLGVLRLDGYTPPRSTSAAINPKAAVLAGLLTAFAGTASLIL